jgi:hypothetical protein
MTGLSPHDTVPVATYNRMVRKRDEAVAERDEARQMLADAWDEGVSFGWHSTELRTDENPYRKAGL